MKKSSFEKIYLYSFDAKGIGGIYFLAFVALYLFFGVITIGTSVSIDFWTGLQMLVACMLIGFSQSVILPLERLNAGRCLAWGAFSAAVTIGFTAGFGWFENFPVWCAVVYCIIMSIGFMMLWPAFYWRSKYETQKLNEKLKAFQSKKPVASAQSEEKEAPL